MPEADEGSKLRSQAKLAINAPVSSGPPCRRLRVFTFDPGLACYSS
jgi:hypothetical protein